MTIELKGLRFFADHGLYAEEAKTGNEFEVEVILEYKAPKDLITSIDQIINYVEVYQIVQKEFGIRHQLLETCAMKIGDELYNNFPIINKINISIKKLTPLLINFVGTLGVSYNKVYK